MASLGIQLQLLSNIKVNQQWGAYNSALVSVILL